MCNFRGQEGGPGKQVPRHVGQGQPRGSVVVVQEVDALMLIGAVFGVIKLK